MNSSNPSWNGPVFDSRLLFHKAPFGAVAAGTPVCFTLCLPKDLPAQDPAMVLVRDGRPGQPLPLRFACADHAVNRYTLTFVPREPWLYFYYFTFRVGEQVSTVKADGWMRGQIDQPGADRMWQLTVYSADFARPGAMGDGIVYQIFPDRFCFSGQPKEHIPAGRQLREDWGGMPVYRPNSQGEVTNSDYFQGDLRGIESKLEYLQSLGVSCIYLNPIFEAHSNHRYNIADYNRVDPLLGDEEDFKRLCAKARERGISVILDGVFSHTGSDSLYFNRDGRYGQGVGAYRDPDSPYRSWYHFQRYPDQYESWWGFATLPNVEETQPDYLRFICGERDPQTGKRTPCVLTKWLDLGAAGYRLDVADELPDEFLDRLRETVKEHSPDHCIIGEVWEDASNKCSYGQRRRYLLGRQLDSVMNYPFRNAVISYIRYGNHQELLTTLCSIVENYPPAALACALNSLSTHDIPRAITALVGEPIDGHDRPWQEQRHFLPLDQYQRGQVLLKLASVIQYFLPGMPCLYYGDEAGLSGYADPFNRCCYPWGNENQELVAWFQKLGQLRRSASFLREAQFLPAVATPELFAFVRSSPQGSAYVAVNRGDGEVYLPLPEEFAQAKATVLCGRYSQQRLGEKSAVVFLV